MALESNRTKRLLDLAVAPAGLTFAEYVAQRRAAGRSWRRISLDVRDEFAFDITPTTLRDWYGPAGETAEAATA